MKPREDLVDLAVREYNVPIWHKAALTIEEAAAYSGIGVNKLRELISFEDCKFVLVIGGRKLIKREAFEQYITESFSI